MNKELVDMEWIERLNQAVNYIEEHLTEDVNYEEAAHVACCSVYHFQRMFSYLAGVKIRGACPCQIGYPRYSAAYSLIEIASLLISGRASGSSISSEARL